MHQELGMASQMRGEIKRFGPTISKFDNTVLMRHENEKLVGIVVSHVDDFLFVGTDIWKQNILKKIKESFSTNIHQLVSFKYLGLMEKQQNRCVMITQDQHIKI